MCINDPNCAAISSSCSDQAIYTFCGAEGYSLYSTAGSIKADTCVWEPIAGNFNRKHLCIDNQLLKLF